MFSSTPNKPKEVPMVEGNPETETENRFLEALSFIEPPNPVKDCEKPKPENKRNRTRILVFNMKES
jgi:hypothetical protein